MPRKEGDAIWKRFRAACDQFFERRKAHFDQLDAERAENMKRKLALCDAAEALARSTELGEAELQEQVRRLRAEWKEVGPAPREQKEQADAAWQRFCDACDRALLQTWAPVLDEPEDKGRFENRLPLKDVAEKLGLSQKD